VLENTPLVTPILGKLNDLRRKFAGLPREWRLDWEDFEWAYAMVKSRAFPFMPPAAGDLSCLPSNISRESVQQLQGALCLLPLNDMLNHQPRTKITWQPTPTSVNFITNEPILAGSEVYNNYGPKSNTELFVGYGFSLPWEIQWEFDYIDFVQPRGQPIYLRNDCDFLQTAAMIQPGASDDAVTDVLISIYEYLEGRLDKIESCLQSSDIYPPVKPYLDCQQMLLNHLMDRLDTLLESRTEHPGQ
jgi:hypothetical protein